MLASLLKLIGLLWSILDCTAGPRDYSREIAELSGRRYCSHSVTSVVPDPAPCCSVGEILGWNPEPWPTYLLLTGLQGPSHDPEAPAGFCGGCVRYHVVCYDRWFRGECLHDCALLGLAEER